MPGLLRDFWISTSTGKHNRETRLSSSFHLSPQLSCEDSQASGIFVSVSLQMSSTAHQRHKCTQLMLSAVLMGFLSLSWHLCRSLNCSHVFPFRRFLRSVMYPPRKLRHSLEGKAELEEVLYNERCFCLLFERTFGSSWHLNLMMLLCLHRQRCQAVVQDKEAALTLSWALVYPVPQSCVPAPSCAPQQGFAVPCQHC